MATLFVPKSKQDVVALGYLAGWKFLGALPGGIAYRLGDLVAGRVVRGGGPAQLRRNLARVLACAPEDVPDALIAASMRSYMRYWVEAFRLPTIASPDLAVQVERGGVGLEQISEAKAAGEPVVLVLPHSGNWDMAGMWLVSRHGRFTTVAERLKPEVLYDAFVQFRESLGFEILPLTGADSAVPQLRKVLEAGGIICLLGDRDLGGGGVPVTFFGESTTMPAGPALLAKQTGARLHAVGLSFTRDGWHLEVHPEVATKGRSIEEITQDVADYFEVDIARHPADWHMLQPLWSADRRARKGK
nr:phosphatidylinositol mannoside acyltransferase [Corynebacterium lactis]